MKEKSKSEQAALKKIIHQKELFAKIYLIDSIIVDLEYRRSKLREELLDL